MPETPTALHRDAAAGVETVYKIMRAADWRAASAKGCYTGSADDARDGFIHLSTADQVPGTAARHFKGQADLVLVALDVGQLGSALRWEPSRGGALFPHLHGPLACTAARWFRPMPLAADGVPTLAGDIV